VADNQSIHLVQVTQNWQLQLDCWNGLRCLSQKLDELNQDPPKTHEASFQCMTANETLPKQFDNLITNNFVLIFTTVCFWVYLLPKTSQISLISCSHLKRAPGDADKVHFQTKVFLGLQEYFLSQEFHKTVLNSATLFSAQLKLIQIVCKSLRISFCLLKQFYCGHDWRIWSSFKCPFNTINVLLKQRRLLRWNSILHRIVLMNANRSILSNQRPKAA